MWGTHQALPCLISGGRLFSGPSGGLAAPRVSPDFRSAFSFWWHSASATFFFFLPLNGVVAKDHGLNVCSLHFRYWKALMLQRASEMVCFVRRCWILQPINAALNKTIRRVSAPFQGQLYWCSPLCLPFIKLRFTVLVWNNMKTQDFYSFSKCLNRFF